MNETQTIKRALDILFLLAEQGKNLSVQEISESESIPESTVYRLIQTLEQNGIVERKSKGQIGLGMRILDLARSLHDQIDRELFVIARPIMAKLTNEINETSVLMVRTGVNVICIQNVESKSLIRFAIENGRILPLHLSASGKMILAYENKRVLDQVLEIITSEKERERLLKDLEEIRNNGYCITIGEIDRDVFGIAAPVFDSYERIIASVAIAGPANRFETSDNIQLHQAIVTAGNQITEKLNQVSYKTK